MNALWNWNTGVGGSTARISTVIAVCIWTAVTHAASIAIPIPNQSFESPVVPPESPYASPAIDDWQKPPQPGWYDPAQNQDTPWAYLVGQFYNVPFPGVYITNAHGQQAAFLFALPEMALFQDYDSRVDTNATRFDAKFHVGSAYELKALVLGGGGGMKPGATLQIGLYYRDASNNIVTVASTTVTNSTELFPTNTAFVDFAANLPAVKASDAWAGKQIGVRLLSTVGFELAGGYWDIENVRLTEIAPGPDLGDARLISGQFVFSISSEPGSRVEVLTASDLSAPAGTWESVGTYTNTTGVLSVTNSAASTGQKFYRARQL